jgi:pimeloyl-ACP methyl ester carboxylesterase
MTLPCRPAAQASWVHGNADCGEKVAQANGNATVVKVAGAPHGLALTRAHEVNKAIFAFLES